MLWLRRRVQAAILVDDNVERLTLQCAGRQRPEQVRELTVNPAATGADRQRLREDLGV